MRLSRIGRETSIKQDFIFPSLTIYVQKNKKAAIKISEYLWKEVYVFGTIQSIKILWAFLAESFHYGTRH